MTLFYIPNPTHLLTINYEFIEGKVIVNSE